MKSKSVVIFVASLALLGIVIVRSHTSGGLRPDDEIGVSTAPGKAAVLPLTVDNLPDHQSEDRSTPPGCVVPAVHPSLDRIGLTSSLLIIIPLLVSITPGVYSRFRHSLPYNARPLRIPAPHNMHESPRRRSPPVD